MNLRKPSKRVLTALTCVASGAIGFGTYKYYIKVHDTTLYILELMKLNDKLRIIKQIKTELGKCASRSKPCQTVSMVVRDTNTRTTS